MQTEYQEVLIAGGGPAGLSAALTLGRARRAVLVLDTEQPRHAVSEHVQGYPTRDGVSPTEYRQLCWTDLQGYPEVRRSHDEIQRVEDDQAGLIVYTASGRSIRTEALILAVGVRDEHPDIPGFDKLWGSHIFHCPYCHGWELRDQPLGVLCRPPLDCVQTQMLQGWSERVTCFTNGHDMDRATHDGLRRTGVRVVTSKIAELVAQPDHELPLVVRTEDGECIPCAGLFTSHRQHPVGLVSRLGLRMMEQAYIEVDEERRTSRARIWAVGDCTSKEQSVLHSAAQGAQAAQSVNAALTMAGQ